MRALDDIDRSIIVATQGGLPLVPDPYGAVAEALGLEPDLVMARLAAMQADGIVRRIAAVPNHYALGYRFNGMTVWDVADEAVEEAGRRMVGLGFVSHCYQRPRRPPYWPYNLFAMIHARDEATAKGLVEDLAAALGELDRGHQVLFSTRILKKTGLRLT
ncbi:MAG TPA: Lrp/AsnC family transcriptional regulator [Magnetospirillum sp.]|jgi:DNA-binding Lrp family transcriptional regulator|nr:Lrp/AsnC family transcriptional regulator [Magnetospirillum sp.]